MYCANITKMYKLFVVLSNECFLKGVCGKVFPINPSNSCLKKRFTPTIKKFLQEESEETLFFKKRLLSVLISVFSA